MKRLLFLLLLSELPVTLPAFGGCTNFRLPEAVTPEHNRITVGVFPQVELISIVQSVSRYPETFAFLMAKDSSAYAGDAARHFVPYRDYPAVKMPGRLSLQPGMLNFSAPSNIMLMADELMKNIRLYESEMNTFPAFDSFYPKILEVFQYPD